MNVVLCSGSKILAWETFALVRLNRHGPPAFANYCCFLATTTRTLWREPFSFRRSPFAALQHRMVSAIVSVRLQLGDCAMHGSLETIDYVDQHSLWATNQFAKYRVQVPIILISTALLQFASIAVQTGGLLEHVSLNNSILATLGANFLSLVVYRRLRHYPGTRRLAFILPSFVTVWAGVVAYLLISRVQYSALQLTLGFASGLGFTFVLNTWIRQAMACSWLVIPSPRVAQLLGDLPNLSWDVASSAEQVATAQRPIIVDLRSDFTPEWEAAIAQAAVDGLPIYHVKQLHESLTGRVQIEHLSENASGSLTPDTTYAVTKGLAERAIAAALLIAASPILVTAAIAIRIETPGPAIFRQVRIGFKGERFTILKLRTMVHAPECTTRLTDMTQPDDPRITRVGAFLRKSRIDELPQLVNVMYGQMSLIGPRPETENLSAWYRDTIYFYQYRHAVLPGITGWAQVKQGHVVSPEDVLRKLEYDLFYIKHYSLWLDMVVALKTIKVMLLKLGAK